MIDLSLLQDFITEANEHLEEMESSLLRLEKEPDANGIMNDIFRAIHTIKGASQFVGLARISALAHTMENLLDLLRQGEKELNQEITDTLIATKDRLTSLTHELELHQTEESGIEDLLARILALSATDQPGVAAAGEIVAAEPAPPPGLAEALEEALNTSILDGELSGATLGADLDTAILGDDLDPAIRADDLDTSILGDGLDSSFLGADLDTSMLDDDLDTSMLDDTPPGADQGDGATAAMPAGTLDDELIRSELAEETDDEELNEIFIQQTRNNFALLGELVGKLADPDTGAEFLERGKACLANLRSSANYMGYANLLGRYDIWQAELAAAAAAKAAGQEISFAFMTDHLQHLCRICPQLAEPAASAAGAATDASARPDSGATVGLLSDLEADAIRSEISEEVYDDELFGIFLKQVATSIGAIRRGLAESAASADKSAFLAQCGQVLTSLKSAANYMGYKHLLALYEQWRTAVAAAEPTSDIDFIADYLEQMAVFFPNLTELLPPAAAADIFAEPEGRPVLGEAPGASDQANDEQLFAALSGSVDAAMADVKLSGVAPLHNILEEMLFTDEDEVPVAPEKKSGPVAKPKAKMTPAKAKPAPEEPETTAAAEPEDADAERRRRERRQEERRQEPVERTYKQSIRVDSDKIDSLMNQVGELVVSRAYFAQIYNYLKELQRVMKEENGLDAKELKPIRELAFKLGEATVGLGRVSNELQEGVMKIRMLPVSQLFNRYPRLVRDLVHKSDKKVELVVRGEDTELDKMVIEEISDPLIHIIRNAVDHGLETPAERKKAGKPETGTLTLEAFHESNHIVIEITDDGRGIDIEKVKLKAHEKGLISRDELSRLSDAEARRFIMMPGFSTADTPTETSGRGVGMDVIKTNIEKLNGTVEVDSQFGIQTMIRIKIPLTLAIIQALMVRVGDEMFTIPLSVVEETLRIFEHETSTIEGVEVIHMRNTTMPIFRLADIFGVEGGGQDASRSFVVIVTTGMQEIGLVVDELIGQEEVVIKPLVDYLRGKSGFSGATIIGDGRISLILDVYELVKMTSEKQIARTRQQTQNRKDKTKVIKSRKVGQKQPAARAATIH
jgi:two-component system chemotaxis sensor kinase CheA